MTFARIASSSVLVALRPFLGQGVSTAMCSAVAPGRFFTQ
ncbi:hypothetical protein CA11_29050 [Gimesia maris]|nr:hypothetical protein CA11_29050 [Gimesia maris]